MSSLAVGNLWAWAVQVAVIAAAGLALPALLRITAPAARLVYLRAILLACLVLPMLQPWVPVPAASAPGVSAPAPFDSQLAGGRGATMVVPGPGGTVWPWTLEQTLVGVALGGALARFAWLGLGLWSLQRIRRRGRLITPVPGPVEDAMRAVGVSAGLLESDAVTRPVTFGLRRPVVVVPEDYRHLSPQEQRTVAMHELLHVRRRDWIRTLGDEVVKTVLWFHPAIWWLTDQIQLGVEQVVDREVVRLSGARRPYLDALLKIAASQPAPVLQPASMFLKQRHLAQRIASLVKEVPMSRARLAISLASACAVLVAGGGLVIQAFPLKAAASPVPTQASAVEQPGPAADMLPQAATPPASTQSIPKDAVRVGGKDTPTPKKVKDVRPDYPAEAKKAGVEGTVILEALIGEKGTVTAVKVLRSVPLLDEAAKAALLQWEFEPTHINGVAMPVVMTVTMRFRLDNNKTGDAKETAAPSTDPSDPWYPPDALRLKPDLKPPKKVVDVRPVYPEEARKAGVQGMVIIEVVIGTDGKVAKSRVIRSVPGLDEAALEAVSQWKFQPMLLNGVPQRAVATLTINFTLK